MSQTIDIRIYAFLTLTTIPPVNSKTNIYQSLCVCICVCVCVYKISAKGFGTQIKKHG